MEQAEAIISTINVLVVDDMESMRGMVNGCLRELGVEKSAMANNGEAAWKLLTNKKFDLVICDWDMPEVTGLDLLKRIRQSEKHNHLPFLMLTATTKKEQVVSAIEAGVTDYLTKPFQPKELAYRVVKLLHKIKRD
ncbi:chemotaxis response regulator CheY [Maricurvus nonylphenolicus]|uniref:response regulator n=1 Tax=Maricurvus nonylphenolicus TaxID=1008307 RepID=UPI0036F44871